MFFYLVQTFLGPHPPPGTAYYLAFDPLWSFAPMPLGLRVYLGLDVPGREIIPAAPGTAAVVSQAIRIGNQVSAPVEAIFEISSSL